MDPVDDDALPPSARQQPQTAAPAVRGARPTPPSEDDLPPSAREAQAAEKEAARPSQNPLVAGWEATKEAAHGVWKGLGPAETPTEGPLESAQRIGGGLLSAAGLPFAPIVGAGKSIIAHGTAPALRAAEYGIKKGIQYFDPKADPKVQTHQEAYEALLPGAEAAISALGPKRLPGGQIAPIAPVRRVPSGGLMTKGGQEVTAGKMLEKAAVDPDAAIGALDAAKEVVPGSKPTAFQASGDLGLGQLERVVQNTPEGQAAFQQRWAEQNNARTNALRGVQQGGDANTVHTHLRTAMEADDALAEMELAAARTRAEQASTDLGPNVTPEIQGQILRRELDEAHQRIKTRETEAWNAVDPNGTLFTNAGPVSNAQFRIYGEMSEAAAAGMTEPERTISGIISRYPQTVPFRDMRDLRSLVTTSMREELRARGPSPTYARLSQLRGAIEESTRNPVDARTGQLAPDAKTRLDTASDITRQRADTFKQGPVEDVLKREGAAGPYDVTYAAVPGRFIPNGPKGYDHVASYLRAVGNQRGLPDIYDALVYDMRSKAMDANGNINPDRLVRWAQSKQDALRAVVERDGGELVRRLQNVEGAEGAIADIAAQRAELARLHRVGVFGKLIGVDNPTDVQNILGGIFGKQTSVTDAQAIMQRLRASPEAQVGARQAIVDWIWDKFISNTAAGTTDENIIRADQFQQFIKLKEQTLRAFGFTPDQISTWQMISDDMRMTKQSIDATKMRGGPGTAQDLNAMYQMREDLGQNLFRRIAYRLMAGSLGWAAEGPLGGAAAMFGAGVVSSMRDRGIKSVQALVKDAMMNPARARTLLARARGREVMPRQKTWIGYEAAAQQQGQQQQLPSQGFKHGGAVRPLGREGIKARNKARAVEARERSSLARRSTQAKRKVRYQNGGSVPYPVDSPEFKEEVARALAKNQDTIAAAQEFYPRVPLNDKAWSQFIENAPASINIEDRRPGYKGGLRAAYRRADGGGVNADSSEPDPLDAELKQGIPRRPERNRRLHRHLDYSCAGHPGTQGQQGR